MKSAEVLEKVAEPTAEEPLEIDAMNPEVTVDAAEEEKEEAPPQDAAEEQFESVS